MTVKELATTISLEAVSSFGVLTAEADKLEAAVVSALDEAGRATECVPLSDLAALAVAVVRVLPM